MTTEVTLPLAGGTFRFHLTDMQMFYLETGTSAGGIRSIDALGGRARPIIMGEAYARILRGRYELNGKNVGLLTEGAFSTVEMDAIIRAALLGGGGGDLDGKKIDWNVMSVDGFMKEHVAPMPLMDRWDLCLAIMGARVEGISAARTGSAVADE